MPLCVDSLTASRPAVDSYEAPDLQTSRAKVEQQAKIHAGRNKVVDQLRLVRWADCTDGFVLYKYLLIDNHVGKEVADHNSVIPHLKSSLALKCDADSPELVGECFSVNGLQEPWSQCVVDSQGAT